MRKSRSRLMASVLSLGMVLSGLSITAAADTPQSPEEGVQYELVWSDEFNGDSLNQEDWNVEAHKPGWVNKELQRYVSADDMEDNIQIVQDENGSHLSIRPTVEKKGGSGGEVDLLDGNGFGAGFSGAGASVEDGKATIVVTSVGTNPWDVQFQKTGMNFEAGHKYRLSFKAKASVKKTIEFCATNTSTYNPFNSARVVLETTEGEYSLEFDGEEHEEGKAAIQFNLGNCNDDTSVAATVELYDAKLIDLDAEGSGSAEIIPNGFDEFGGQVANWDASYSTVADVTIENGTATAVITNPGKEPWHVQFQKAGMNLIKGHNYKVSFDAVASQDKKLQISATNTSTFTPYDDTTIILAKDVETTCELEFAMGEQNKDEAAIQINLGYFVSDPSYETPVTVTMTNLSLVDLTAAAAAEPEAGEEEFSLDDYNFTSGRINTQGKQDFKYGYFECSARVPKGAGYLPAFWLMATDEQNYGQWPKCGEIDIMEVMGQNTAKSYHTIHYGYDSESGHRENQGTYVIGNPEDDFYSQYHTFALEWLPGKLTWYVDGVQVYETNDWYTGNDKHTNITYPAPFDQDFYIILNLAVGGNWVQYPDEAAVKDMNNQSYDIDYVRVYQLPEETYAEMEANAQAPEHVIEYREADDSGNFIRNGKFRKDLKKAGTVGANFELHLESDADDTTYERKNNAITIYPDSVGVNDYSIQLKQDGLPIRKGWEYTVSFKACASENRTMLVNVEGPYNGYTRYYPDTAYNLTTEMQEYTFDFTMTEDSDANGSLEFCLGKQGSTAAVTISDVVLKVKTEGPEQDIFEKQITADGNYVYNGTFDQGDARLGYWEVSTSGVNEVVVTNDNMRRELQTKIVVDGSGTVVPVQLDQTEMAPMTAGKYLLTFDAYSPDAEENGMSVLCNGGFMYPALTAEKTTFEFSYELDHDVAREDTFVKIVFSKPGTYYLDNVAIRENAVIKNASFNSGLASYEPASFTPGSATFGVDSIQEGNDHALDVHISSVGEADWNVQVKQRGITLETGHTYRLKFEAKSDVDRTISVVMQRDGANDDNWAVYSGDNNVTLTNEWQTFTKTFVMENDTDNNALLSVSLGKFDDIEADVEHHVYMDNFNLEEVTDDWPFTDVEVNPGNWVYEGVKYVYDTGLMTGDADTDGDGLTTFRPKANINRYEFIVTLYRLAGSPEVTITDSGLSDISLKADGSKPYYYDAVLWAVENEITTGKTKDGKQVFAGKDQIKRQEIATMLMRFAAAQGMDVSAQADITGFVDYDKVSSYAREAMSWANAMGLITGKEDKTTGVTALAPKDNAQRREVATILMRFDMRDA